MINRNMMIFISFLFFFTYIIGLIFHIGVTDTSNLVTFLSIIVGFFMSALAILYASPLRKVLYREPAKKYPNKWIEIVEKYKFTTIFSMISVLIMLIDIKIPEIIFWKTDVIQRAPFYLAVSVVAVYLFINIVLTLFKNLSFAIND